MKINYKKIISLCFFIFILFNNQILNSALRSIKATEITGYFCENEYQDRVYAIYNRKIWYFRDEGAFKTIYENKEDNLALLKFYSEQDYKKEKNLLLSLDHSNIINILNFDDDNLILVQELAVCSLYKYIFKARKKKIDIKVKIKILIDIINGIGYIHSLDKVYKDLKPGNILLFQDSDGNLTAKVSDLGSCVKSDESDSIIGTLEYTDPLYWKQYRKSLLFFNSGQYRKPLSHKHHDIFSFAVLMYELLYEKTILDDCVSCFASKESELNLELIKLTKIFDLEYSYERFLQIWVLEKLCFGWRPELSSELVDLPENDFIKNEKISYKINYLLELCWSDRRNDNTNFILDELHCCLRDLGGESLI